MKDLNTLLPHKGLSKDSYNLSELVIVSNVYLFIYFQYTVECDCPYSS